MTKKKKNRIRIIIGFVLCVLLLTGTAGLSVADIKIHNDLKSTKTKIKELEQKNQELETLNGDIESLKQQLQTDNEQ